MTSLLHPQLVNGVFGDPALYVEFQFEKRALLFDLGDLHGLSARKLLRVTDVFISHAHIDHFIGFDQLLRVLVGREATVRLYGPAGIADRIAHKLQGYSWNLVSRFDTELTFVVTELLDGERARRVRFRLRAAFAGEDEEEIGVADGVLFRDAYVTVRAAIMDHQIPCLAFAVEEPVHVNIWKPRLAEHGFPTGPWLAELKRLVLEGAAEDTLVDIPPSEKHGEGVRRKTLGWLRNEVLRVGPGLKIGYVVDTLYCERNVARLTALMRDADILFIEATFAREDTERAADRYHLTTEQAGRIGRAAGAKRLEPFHFSPRYADEEAQMFREVREAFEGI